MLNKLLVRSEWCDFTYLLPLYFFCFVLSSCKSYGYPRRRGRCVCICVCVLGGGAAVTLDQMARPLDGRKAGRPSDSSYTGASQCSPGFWTLFLIENILPMGWLVGTLVTRPNHFIHCLSMNFMIVRVSIRCLTISSFMLSVYVTWNMDFLKCLISNVRIVICIALLRF